MDQISSTTLTLVFGVIALGALLAWPGILMWRRWHARPDRVIARISAHQLSDIVLPDGMDGEIHLDQLLLTEKGLLVLDVRNVSGLVFAGEQMDDWTVLHDNRRFTFRNPLTPLAARVHAVRDLAGDVPVSGRIVFVGDVEFPGGHIDEVLTLKELEDEYKTVSGEPSGSAIQAFHGSWGKVEQQAQPAAR
jgi:hypothetical protein